MSSRYKSADLEAASLPLSRGERSGETLKPGQNHARQPSFAVMSAKPGMPAEASVESRVAD